MQETRQIILEILRELGQGTVDDIVEKLRARRGPITAVTVRHHLARLQEDRLIEIPQLRYRSSPGRPQYVYVLTEQAREYFPKNYSHLLRTFLQQLKSQLPSDQVDQILDGVAERMLEEAKVDDGTLPQRVDQLVSYLNTHGYKAEWENGSANIVLRICNCPYYDVPERVSTICQVDLQLIASTIGIIPEVQSRVSESGNCCVYVIPVN